MKRNMKQWLQDYLSAPTKKAMPILSFPGVQLMGKTVDELVRDGHLQALCMKAMADKYLGITDANWDYIEVQKGLELKEIEPLFEKM